MDFNNNYDYYAQLIKDLEEYIQDELQDTVYYKEMATIAPTNRAKELITEFSEDEYSHAENFQQVYRAITGSYYDPKPTSPVTINNYEEAIKVRILAETKDYQKYGEQYLKAPDKYLQDLFFNVRTTEAQHAMRMPILFEEG